MPEPAAQTYTETEPATDSSATGNGFKTGDDPRRNAGGRPKGMARLARELTGGDGESILRFYAAAMSGKMTNPEFDPGRVKSAENPEFVVVSERGRLEAAKLLAERGYGKAPQFAPVEDEDPLGLSEAAVNAAAADLDRRVDELAAKRAERDAAPGEAVQG